MSHSVLGIAYVSCQWLLTTIGLGVVTLRVYSRTCLTRSVGSDDFFIVIALVLEFSGTIMDLKAFMYGLSNHEETLAPGGYASEQKWEYIGYLTMYINYFFIRASVLLFVLRLLPSYKKWQQRITHVVFLVSFLVTLYTCISLGVSCRPFKANWETVNNSKCFSKDLVVITNQINAALTCICDIATAVIPVILLWNVQMKAKTKRQLNALFGLSLITAALSIGRAATTTKKNLTEDTTWNMMPSYYFSMFEDKLGIIFACGPAIRQFWAYRCRTNSSLPTRRRQYPNEDFEKMRYRVNLRDIFWYRKAPMVGDRVFDAARIFQHEKPPPDASGNNPKAWSKVKNSILDVWEKKFKSIVGADSEREAIRLPSSENMHSPRSSELEKQDSESSSTNRWGGLFRRSSKSGSIESNKALFSMSNGDSRETSTLTRQPAPSRSPREGEHADGVYDILPPPAPFPRTHPNANRAVHPTAR